MILLRPLIGCDKSDWAVSSMPTDAAIVSKTELCYLRSLQGMKPRGYHASRQCRKVIIRDWWPSNFFLSSHFTRHAPWGRTQPKTLTWLRFEPMAIYSTPLASQVWRTARPIAVESEGLSVRVNPARPIVGPFSTNFESTGIFCVKNTART
jgi:hypothetical protein